jgi:hypothetical protein
MKREVIHTLYTVAMVILLLAVPESPYQAFALGALFSIVYGAVLSAGRLMLEYREASLDEREVRVTLEDGRQAVVRAHVVRYVREGE